MLEYNTHLKELAMPEYGRNIQRMVEHCATIEDRDARNKCAAEIVNTMSILFPASRNDDGSNRTFWNHLAVISRFALDIDWPEDVVTAESIATCPDPVAYDTHDMKQRLYGANVECMIKAASQMTPGEEQTELLTMIANQMKKTLLAAGLDEDPDLRVMDDIRLLSDGVLNVTSDMLMLHDFDIAVSAATKKKKKK